MRRAGVTGEALALLAHAESITAYAEEIASSSPTASWAESQALSHSLMKEITIAPGRRQHPPYGADAVGQSPARRRGGGDGRRRPGTVYRQVRPKLEGKPGLEPGRLAAHDPRSFSSINSDTSPDQTPQMLQYPRTLRMR